MDKVAARLFVIWLLFATAQPASAQSNNDDRNDWLTDRFSATVGAFFPDTDTKLRVDANDGSLGTRIAYEEQLRLSDSETSIDVSLLWRFAKRHSIELEYFDIRRDGVTDLDATIRFGDAVFEEQFGVNSFLDTRVLRIGYGFSFLHSDNYELGAHAGIHVTDVETGIAVESASISGQLSEQFDTTAPLPVLGLYGSYRFAERWLMYGRAQYFELEFGDYDGRMTQVMIGVEHDTFKRVSLGAGYRIFDVVVDIDDDRWVGEVDFQYDGPAAYVRVRFR